jgi:antitoxin (DNA-binding transcriptional repressor) of toxin-antitoxin stability system
MGTLKSVTTQDLRAWGDDIVADVSRGETVIVTRNGEAIAEIRPYPPRGLTTEELIARRRHLPPIDPARLREDIDSVLDQSI